MKKVTLGDRIRYAFDNTLSRGPTALIGWLALISLALVVLASLIIWAARLAPEDSLMNLLWDNLMQTLDPSGIEHDAGDWPFLLTMLGVTLAGILITSTLIGILTAGLEERLDMLRQGRSRVIEENHTVILGWSERVLTILSELVQAGANLRRACVVVMGRRDKVEMENEIREKVRPAGRTRIVCRTGDPIALSDLDILSLERSKTIIILPPEGEEDPDVRVLKTLLAVTNHPDRRPGPYHIVTELRAPRNIEVARLIAGEEVELVPVDNLIARVIAQTCRQSGLSAVYTELLDFAGDEIYFKEEPALVGKTYGEAISAYEDSAVIGLCFRDRGTRLNPPMDTRIGQGDQVIAISEDDDAVRLSGLEGIPVVEEAIRLGRPAESRPEHTLILGWNRRVPMIVRELDAYVAPGSTVTVVADCPGAEEAIAACQNLHNETCRFRWGDTTDRQVLEALSPQEYAHVIVLCYSDLLSVQEADARTLITLLHLRDIAERVGKPFTIVSEMLDVRNRDLAEAARADDFIVSDRLVSLMLAQVSENKALNAVLGDIFDPEGSEIYLKPVEEYVQIGRPLNFYTLLEAARRRGETAIGYRLAAHAQDAARAYGVVINPDKSKEVTFSPGDRVIVLAEG